MKAIKGAGYISIQTSPINAVIPGDNGSKDLKKWYFHYHPTDYTIGNYQWETEDEFKAMAAEADKYGINIIVDAASSHTTTDIKAVSEKIKVIPDWAHGNQGITNDYDRYQVTQYALLGLYDLNTQNKAVQEYLLNYLKQAVADGTDGFRFDAAKHIELPGEFNSDFWTNILANSGAKFQYGEFIRKVIGQGYVKDGDLVNYQVSGVSEDNLITWIESHDNYANDSEESTKLTDQNIILVWSIIGVRKKGAPLFFSRPVGGGGQHERFPGTTKIGDAGSNLFKDPMIVAINNFCNAINGQSEYIRNPNMDQGFVMI